jgi:hypothetical protein
LNANVKIDETEQPETEPDAITRSLSSTRISNDEGPRIKTLGMS